jgi:hypothetical protein
VSDETPGPLPEPEHFEIDRDQFIDLVNKLWDANQVLHDEIRHLEGELLATKVEFENLRKRFDHMVLGVGQVGLLVSIAQAVVEVRDKQEATSEDWGKAFGLVAMWQRNLRMDDE